MMLVVNLCEVVDFLQQALVTLLMSHPTALVSLQVEQIALMMLVTQMQLTAKKRLI